MQCKRKKEAWSRIRDSMERKVDAVAVEGQTFKKQSQSYLALLIRSYIRSLFAKLIIAFKVFNISLYLDRFQVIRMYIVNSCLFNQSFYTKFESAERKDLLWALLLI